ncbi:hypothetical protein [Mesomycoplasma ovipneumoniae]|uniref:hypothetical protein n=1 Tax=Mesomycoplasma ovipneumoniae TaxID=29562 RepID=UPI00311B15EB
MSKTKDKSSFFCKIATWSESDSGAASKRKPVLIRWEINWKTYSSLFGSNL